MSTNLTLSEFPLFNNLPEELLKKLAKISEEKTYEEGDTIFQEGEKADKLHFLLKGSMVLKVKLTSRPESVTVSAVNQKNESFGWSGIVPPHIYTASAICEENCKVLEMPGDKFMELMRNAPESGFFVMLRLNELIARRLRTSRQGLLKTL